MKTRAGHKTSNPLFEETLAVKIPLKVGRQERYRWQWKALSLHD